MPYPKMINDKGAEKLWASGFSDRVIASIYEVTPQSVLRWRKNKGLPAKGKPGRVRIAFGEKVAKAIKILDEGQKEEEQVRERLPGETRNQRCRRCIERNGKCEYSGTIEICRDCGCYWR